jgi:hypothetical protein
MEKIFQILSVFALLILVIKIFAKRLEKDFKEYYLYKRIPLIEGFPTDNFTLDSGNRHLFILTKTKASVIDLDTDEMKELFVFPPGIRSMAVAGPLNKGFISTSEIASVVVLDLISLTITKTISEPGFKDGILFFEPFNNQLFIFNRYKGSAVMIDPDNFTIRGSLGLPGRLSCPTSDESGKIYGIIRDENLLVEIEASSGRLNRQWLIDYGQTTGWLAFDRRNQLLFTVCENNKMGVFDCKAGKLISVISLGETPDSVVFEPEARLIFISNGSGTITILSQGKRDEYKIVQLLPTQKGPGMMAVDAITKKIYLATSTPEPNSEGISSGLGELLVFSNE